MATLPRDIMADILLQLPVKTLLRFKCVSKPWCDLIDSPDFIKAHLKRSMERNTNLSLIVRYDYLYSLEFDGLANTVELDYPLKSKEYQTQVLGSCNGLLCLSNSMYDIALWNPSTRKHHNLPITPTQIRPRPRHRPMFGTPYNVLFGFGYDCVHDDYKLVRIVQIYGENDDHLDSEVEVYSLKSNSWRRIHDFPYDLYDNPSHGVFASGALHWVATPRPEPDEINLIVVAFDLGLEQYREMPQPEYSGENFYVDVGVLGGCLCVICTYCHVSVDLWVMKEYGVKESWTKLVSVLIDRFFWSFNSLRPLAFSKNGSKVLLEQNDKKIVWYDLKKKSARTMIYNISVSSKADICLASLVPINSDGGVDGRSSKQERKRRKRGERRVAKASIGFSPSSSTHARG